MMSETTEPVGEDEGSEYVYEGEGEGEGSEDEGAGGSENVYEGEGEGEGSWYESPSSNPSSPSPPSMPAPSPLAPGSPSAPSAPAPSLPPGWASMVCAAASSSCAAASSSNAKAVLHLIFVIVSAEILENTTSVAGTILEKNRQGKSSLLFFERRLPSAFPSDLLRLA